MFGFLGAFAFGVFGTLVGGWCLSKVWAWFAVPLGIPPITAVHGVGIAIIIALVKVMVSEVKVDVDGYMSEAGRAALNVGAKALALLVFTLFAWMWSAAL